jgi:hypothetical protein
MNKQKQAEQFTQDIDSILHQASLTTNEQRSETYHQDLEIVQALTTADFSADSQVRQTLKQKLRHAYFGQKEYTIMNSKTFPKSFVRLALVGLAIAFLTLAISPLGAGLTQSLVQIVQSWQLGENTTAVRVDNDFEAVQNENGETVISAGPESVIDSKEIAPEQETEAEQQRHITLDPTIGLDRAQARVTFTLRQPAFVPEGYEFQGVVSIHSGQASLEYVNWSDNRLMGLLQTAVGGTNNDVQVTFSGDMVVIDTEVTGHKALWTQADDEGLLVWEADGVNYQLVGLSDLEVALRVAESLQ